MPTTGRSCGHINNRTLDSHNIVVSRACAATYKNCAGPEDKCYLSDALEMFLDVSCNVASVREILVNLS